MHAAGFFDDTEHSGGGALDLVIIMRELCFGSIATGIGFAWLKFTAFATHWNDAIGTICYPFSPSGIHASGWATWNGGIINAIVPRAQVDTIEKLLGKIGNIHDRHSLAALDTVSKIRALRYRATSIRASWGELATMLQLIVRGIVGYAPLVGIPFLSTCTQKTLPSPGRSWQVWGPAHRWRDKTLHTARRWWTPIGVCG